MTIKQYEFSLTPKQRGFHLITAEVVSHIDLTDIKVGVMQLFIKHSSASLTINENADPDVRFDMENLATELFDNKEYYTHISEGNDDMPAHIKASVFGNNVTIPITNGVLNLGIWQGIYLGEHRDSAGSRSLVATILS
jgi:secondary thiamine-phosphate synthase enzyme